MEKNCRYLFLITFLRSCNRFRENVCTTTERFLKFVNTTRGDFDWSIETMRYCRFDLRDPGWQQTLLLTNCVCVPRESSFGKVTKLPSRFQRSLCRGGLVDGSLPTFYCFIGETNCRLASLAGMRLRG